MSCKITVKTQVKDFNTFKKVAREEGWTVKDKNFTKGHVTFNTVQHGEVFDLVCESEYRQDMQTLLQSYAAEMVVQEARKRGLSAKVMGRDKQGNIEVKVICQ